MCIMAVEILTKDDLESFRILLLKEIKIFLQSQLKVQGESPEGYKTSDVRKILGCSVNKLVSLRINRKLRTKKIGGTVYYNKEDIRNLLEQGY